MMRLHVLGLGGDSFQECEVPVVTLREASASCRLRSRPGRLYDDGELIARIAATGDVYDLDYQRVNLEE